MNYQRIALVLRVLTGLLFIFSGITKLFPIEAFELNFVSQGISGWTMASVLARFLIIFEIFLGLGLLQRTLLRKFFIPATIGLLLVFCVYLCYSIFILGETENCGCFGNILPMSPISALIKNIVMIAFLFFVLKYENAEGRYKWERFLPVTFLVLSIAGVLAWAPFKMYERTEASSGEKANFLYINEFSKGHAELGEGKKVVSFVSLACDHCKETARRIGIVDKKIGLPPVYFICWGGKDELEAFKKESQTDYPFIILETKEFFDVVGHYVPRVCWLEDGIIKYDWNYHTFDVEQFEEIAETHGDR